MNERLKDTGWFWLRFAHSVSGMWLAVSLIIFFLAPYSAAISSQAAFDRVTFAIHRFSLWGPLLFIFVIIPFAFHSIVSLLMAYRSQFNVLNYGSYRNWMYVIERISGVLLVPFIIYHLAQTELPYLEGRVFGFEQARMMLAKSTMRSIYAAGIVMICVYATGSFARFLSLSGIVAGRRSKDAIAAVMWVVAFVFAGWGLRVLFAF